MCLKKQLLAPLLQVAVLVLLAKVALVAAVEGLEVVPNWERTPEFLSTWINQGPGAELLATAAIHYHCRCTRDALVATLSGFYPKRIQELFEAGSPVEVRCDYCGKVYQIPLEDLAGPGEQP